MGDPKNPTCLDCDYSLRGLASPFCPECGRAFNSNDPRTYGPALGDNAMKGWAVVVMLILFNTPIVIGFLVDLSSEILVGVASGLVLTFMWAAWFFPSMFRVVYNKSADRDKVKKDFLRTLVLMALLMMIFLLF